MQETEQERREIGRIRRRNLLVGLPIMVGFLSVAWWASRWIRARYGFDMDLSRNLGILGLAVLAMPVAFYMDRKRRRSGA